VRLGKDIDLTTLAAVRAWPGESGCSLTGRLIAPQSQGESVANRWVRGIAVDRKHLAFAAAEAIGNECWSPSAEPRPAALVLGGDPSGALAALIDWTGIDGHTFAGCLRNQAWDVAPARSQPLTIPADAELVIEGTLSPAPSGDATNLAGPEVPLVASIALADPSSGYYQPSLSNRSSAAPGWWLLEVTAITHRVHAVMPITIVGDSLVGRLTGEMAVFNAIRASLLTPLLKAAIPELVDCSLPAIGGSQGFAVLAIRKTYPGQARRAAHALWGLAPLEGTRWVVIVDDDVDVRQPAAVLSRVATNVSADRDLMTLSGPGSANGLAASRLGLAERVAIDATAKLPAECGRAWPERLMRPGAVLDLVTKRWKEYGLPPLS
jgi:4-hydroxy-3-polyprenylbenzoate decarboxylase